MGISVVRIRSDYLSQFLIRSYLNTLSFALLSEFRPHISDNIMWTLRLIEILKWCRAYAIIFHIAVENNMDVNSFALTCSYHISYHFPITHNNPLIVPYQEHIAFNRLLIRSK